MCFRRAEEDENKEEAADWLEECVVSSSGSSGACFEVLTSSLTSLDVDVSMTTGTCKDVTLPLICDRCALSSSSIAPKSHRRSLSCCANSAESDICAGSSAEDVTSLRARFLTSFPSRELQVLLSSSSKLS